MKAKSVMFLGACVALLMGCATETKSPSEREALRSAARSTLTEMKAKDDGLGALLDRSHGYAVFPNVGKGGLIVGGAAGRGVVYEKGQRIGYATLNEASAGAQIGGQTYSELIIFENENSMGALKAGNFEVGATASAVALKAGAAASTQFDNGVAIFIHPKGGLMAEASVSGQKIKFQSQNDVNDSARLANDADGDGVADDADRKVETKIEVDKD